MTLMNDGVEHPLRVMSLHALAYCPRLFYLEEVEEIRVANAAVFAGRALHSELAADEAARECARNILGRYATSSISA